MKYCPQCGKAMTDDFLNEITDKLENELKATNKLGLDMTVQAECCGKELRAIIDPFNCYIISQPARFGEVEVIIGEDN